MSTRAFMIAAVGATLLAVIAGAYVVGSPSEARRRTFDDRRYQELAMLAGTLLCTSDKTTVLPVALTTETLRSYCGARNLQPPAFLDDETGEPYKYTRKSGEDYSICAKFHDTHRVARLSSSSPNTRWAFEPASGCITGRIR